LPPKQTIVFFKKKCGSSNSSKACRILCSGFSISFHSLLLLGAYAQKLMQWFMSPRHILHCTCKCRCGFQRFISFLV